MNTCLKILKLMLCMALIVSSVGCAGTKTRESTGQ